MLFLVGSSLHSQEKRPVYLKANALFLPLGIVNAGAEFGLSKNTTLQADVFISPWKSLFGNHAQVYMAHLEGRYYFDESFRKWYIGLNVGSGVFDLTKWNYFGTENYQRGFTFMGGATVGYQFQWKENWNIDLFLGGGTVQSFYHGYARQTDPPGFYRYDGAAGWNKSGELIPYRGGLLISYKLK